MRLSLARFLSSELTTSQGASTSGPGGLPLARPDKRVLVVGDVMLDEFVWGKVSRISPEAPVPVVQVTGQSFHLGGAGNVAANVRTLGGAAALVGLVGRDAAGSRVREALDTRGVAERLVDAGAARRTTLKTRIVAHGQQVVAFVFCFDQIARAVVLASASVFVVMP